MGDFCIHFSFKRFMRLPCILEGTPLTILDAIIQGIIQGLTEFLPVSSSGHLSLVQHFTGQSGEAGAFFSILLHLGTLLAVFLAFYKTITDLVVEFFAMAGDLFRGRFSLKEAGPKRRMVLLLIVSLLPMALVVFLRDFYSSLSANASILEEGFFFLLTSVLLFLSDKCVKGHKKAGTMRYKDALAIGITQAVAPLPGLSRSGSTISVGLIVGLEREFAVAFSFIMGVPTVLAANVLEIGDAVKEGALLSFPVVLIGILTSLVCGLLAIKMVKWLVTSNKFKYFAWYTLVLGVIVVAVGLFELVTGNVVSF